MPAEEIMRKFHKGTLRDSHGKKVTKLSQAKAIASSYGKSHSKRRKSHGKA